MSTSKSSYKVPTAYNFKTEKEVYRTNKAKANKGGDVSPILWMAHEIGLIVRTNVVVVPRSNGCSESISLFEYTICIKSSRPIDHQTIRRVLAPRRFLALILAASGSPTVAGNPWPPGKSKSTTSLRVSTTRLSQRVMIPPRPPNGFPRIS